MIFENLKEKKNYSQTEPIFKNAEIALLRTSRGELLQREGKARLHLLCPKSIDRWTIKKNIVAVHQPPTLELKF